MCKNLAPGGGGGGIFPFFGGRRGGRRRWSLVLFIKSQYYKLYQNIQSFVTPFVILL